MADERLIEPAGTTTRSKSQGDLRTPPQEGAPQDLNDWLRWTKDAAQRRGLEQTAAAVEALGAATRALRDAPWNEHAGRD